ncbi:MAG: DUF2225 domain-containing protein [Clostridium sp.]|jgi:uncharacterized protein (DUF2225 family)|uniref:DUF2225 domain-containing protein n=1 Tax=Clostridium sp. TaxID=1506 RepID=UPI0025BA43F0|nr:DUF2225 domain-containing protein [Clostridium sp.]MCH3965251.1 DUF2225 domain-containing protein [Clostridium sp.]MCI1714471.1 DUF2225 domain-containing protein [Clostridium sp.]MCI1798733.1 DUF2225 domain-containing protein [Clostridium sp.]MCI1812536.1 DUF2225 domain-containing protein [Clostridium sp.]MCI1869543.1 DUF2225 domain-containing protein [Clostridium sp.]
MSKETDNSILYDPQEQIFMLYDKKVSCPVCGTSFKARSIKKGSYRILKKDSDFFIRYSRINPYFYDVWVCDECGYAAIKNDFEKLSDYDAQMIKGKISPKWKHKNYPEVYDINLAIQRYKLSLLNYYTINSKASKKAINCLKLAWMYRLKDDHGSELQFLKQALNNFSTAYYNEPSPICGMDKYTTMYLIGELKRRLGDGEESLIWFSQVMTSPTSSQKIKDLAREQRDLIKSNTENTIEQEQTTDNKQSHKFFHKFRK